MGKKLIYIVGDKFNNFGMFDNVYSFSEFIDELFKNKSKKDFDKILLGQGLSIQEKKILSIISCKNGLHCLEDIQLDIAKSITTHKHNSANIMIAEPTKHQEYTYLSKLYIDDSCAEMSDHTTGYHIQGMVLMEAARQMMLSVAENFILAEEERGNSYCALLRVSSQYFQFGFPIETKIIHTIDEIINTKPGRYKAKTHTDFIQNGQIITTVEIDYLFNNKEIMYQKEQLMAKEALLNDFNHKQKSLHLPLTA